MITVEPALTMLWSSSVTLRLVQPLQKRMRKSKNRKRKSRKRSKRKKRRKSKKRRRKRSKNKRKRSKSRRKSRKKRKSSKKKKRKRRSRSLRSSAASLNGGVNARPPKTGAGGCFKIPMATTTTGWCRTPGAAGGATTALPRSRSRAVKVSVQ